MPEEDEAVTLDQVPGAHEMHDFVELDPITVDQLPSWQFKQVVAVVTEDHVPGRQDLHALADEAPRTVLNLPEPHDLQVWRVEAITDDHVPAAQNAQDVA